MTEHRAKKRRLDDNEIQAQANTFKPSARFYPTAPRKWTVSVAVPTSIISECITKDQRAIIAGRIGRALAVFSIDEIVIFDDAPPAQRTPAADPGSYTGDTDPAHFLTHILSYLETPPFMRKTLFPLHPNLRTQGLLPSLDMPHHPHKNEWLPYREGMTLDKKPQRGRGTQVDIGLAEPVTICDSIPPRTRVTLQYEGGDPNAASKPVHPAAPRTEAGYFWGYSVRKCSSLSNVFAEAPFDGGYDVSIGTSERGQTVSRAFPDASRMLDFEHLLVVFGGPRGLEYAAMNDEVLAEKSIAGGRTKELFDHWINVLPNQGSRTIRTEEAMLIALMGLRRLWDQG